MSQFLRQIWTVAALSALVSGCASPQPRLLPICNLKCGATLSCTQADTVSSGDVEKIFDRLSDTFHTGRIELVSITNGYAVLLAKDEADQKLREAWPAVGCFTSTMPPTNADYARLQQCTSGMNTWTSFRKPSDSPSLLLDQSFRRTCMSSTD